MKKIIVLLGCCLLFSIARPQAITIDAIKEATKKVLNAIDLKIQRLQTNTIWLQNAQKELENILSKVKLGDIATWVEKQRKLYNDYFQELWTVKKVISDYRKFSYIISLQTRIVQEYKRGFALLSRDGHFSAEEIRYMQQVYGGILEESVKNLDQVLMVAGSFLTQMTDGKRLSIIDDVTASMQEHYNHLSAFTRQNMLLSVQRATDEGDARTLRKLYGLP